MPDFTKTFDSVEELEKMLEEEYSQKEEEETEKLEEEEIDEEEVDEDTQVDEEVFDEEELELEETEESELEPTKETKVIEEQKTKVKKEEFAFNKLRATNTELSQKVQEREEKLAHWEEIAISYGYANAEEMAKAVKEQRLEKEAREKNIDPVIFKRLNELENRLVSAEKEKEQLAFAQQKNKFISTFDTFISENKLTDIERDQVVKSLEEEGWGFDDLIKIKNPKKLLQGYAIDILSERKVQDVLSKEKKSLTETKFKNSGDVSKTIDDIVNDDLKKYAKDRGITF